MMWPNTVSVDPGVLWTKDVVPSIEAPPDEDTDPAPEARWSTAAIRTGLCGVVTPNVVPRPEGGFRMYYTQILPRLGQAGGANDYDQSTTRILSAISDDGVTWAPEAGVRLSAVAGGARGYRVVSPEVVPVPEGDGRLRMYYECCPGSAAAGATIRSALSEDGLNWVAETGNRISGTGSYCSPRLLFLDDGRCRLYYASRGHGIVSALSTDGGLTFESEPGIRMAPGTIYDAQTAFSPAVLRIVGEGYRIYYAGYSGPTRAYILTALSEDGLHWERGPEPVISPGGPVDGAKCSEMCVSELPGSSSGGTSKFRLHYEACDGTSTAQRGVWRIAGATSAA